MNRFFGRDYGSVTENGECVTRCVRLPLKGSIPSPLIFLEVI